MEYQIALTSEEKAAGKLSEPSREWIRRRYQATGFVQIDNVFERSFVQQLQSAFLESQKLEKSVLEPVHKKVGNRRYHVTMDMMTSFGNPDLYANPFIVQMMEGLLGSFVLNSYVTVVSLPGAKDQHIHMDFGRLFPELPALCALMPPFCITLGIPLVDLNSISGTTAVWLGSHRDPSVSLERLPALPPTAPEVPMGSAYLMDYNVWHYGLANRGTEPRPILYLTYSRPWFLDSTNFTKHKTVEMSPEALARIAPEHRYLFREAH